MLTYQICCFSVTFGMLTHLKIFLFHNKKYLVIKPQSILKSQKVIVNCHKIFFHYIPPNLTFLLHLC